MSSRSRVDGGVHFLACIVSAAIGAATMLVAALAWPTVENETDGSQQLRRAPNVAAGSERLERELERLRKENRALRSAGDRSEGPGEEPEVAPGHGDVINDANPPVARTDPYEVLAALRAAIVAGQGGAIWGHSKRMRELLLEDPGTGVAAIVDALAADPEAAFLVSLGHLLARRDLPLDPEQTAALRDSLYLAALEADDPADAVAALGTLQRLLKNHNLDGGALEEEQIISLSSVLSEPTTDAGLRRQAMRLLNRNSAGHLAFSQALHSILAGDSDSRMRASALQTLRGQQPQEAVSLLLDVLQTEADPVVLWEASRPVSFLTSTSGSIVKFKLAYRDLLHREIDDRARGQAAQSLALIATLDGDETIPGELRYLASSTGDAQLAEFARTAADLLVNGTATIPKLGQLWQRWHRTLDREDYP